MLDLGLSVSRFNEGNLRPAQTRFKPAEFGLPAYLDAKAGEFHVLPALNLDGMTGIAGAYPTITSRGTTGELTVTMTTIRRDHSLKYGWNQRYWFTQAGPGFSSGSFTFGQTYMRAADNTTTAGDLGLSWAAFMMGLPTTSLIDTNDSAFWSTHYRALFLQDDWRLTAALRLSLGLRYEREAGITERFNRGVGNFTFDTRLPISELAEAAYARNPLTELSAAQFKVLGGAEYLGAREKTLSDGTHRLLPRAGVAYEINSRTVLRGGYGWYYDTFNVNNFRPSQLGYSLPTSTPVSNDNGLTFCCGAAGGRRAARRTWRWLDVDFEPAGLERGVGQPATIRRELRIVEDRGAFQEHERFELAG